MSPAQSATRQDITNVTERAYRRLVFVLLLICVSYVFLFVTMWLTFDLRSTVDRNSRIRQQQIAALIRKIDHLNHTLAFLDHGRRR